MSKIKRVWIPVEGFVEEVDDPFDDRMYFHLNNGKVISMHSYVKENAVDGVMMENLQRVDDKRTGDGKE